jgi:hypothetical protein
MALDPESLLIFRVRKGEPLESAKKAEQAQAEKKSEQKPQQQQKQQSKKEQERALAKGKVKGQPLELSKYSIPATEEPAMEPVIIDIKPKRVQPVPTPEVQKPKPVAQPVQEVQKPKPQPAPQPQIQKVQAQPIQESPKPKPKVEYAPPKNIPIEEEQQARAAPEQVLETPYPLPSSLQAGNEPGNKREGGIKSTQQQSRDAAKGKACTNHPWIESYAMCAYCHRPFCFRDIIEFNRNYYCLEDIDHVSTEYATKVTSARNNIALVSGALLMVAFALFIYFANVQVANALLYLHNAGLPFFLAHINYSYTFSLLEAILMVLCFVDAMLLFVHTSNATYIGTLACFFTVTTFCYEYLSTGMFYFAVVAIIVFGAFVTILLSERNYVPEEVSSPITALDMAAGVTWPNIGRF